MILTHYLVKCEDGMWLAEPGIPVEGFVFFTSKLDKNTFPMKRKNIVRKQEAQGDSI